MDFAAWLEGCQDLLIGVPGVFAVARCTQCGLLATRPQPGPREIVAWYPPAYAAAAYGDTGGLRSLAVSVARVPYRLLQRPVARVGAPPPGGGRRLLDVGCGDGAYLQAMAAAGWDACGIEPGAAPAVDASIEPRVYRGTVESARYEPGSFDLATLWHVLEHLHDPRAALERIRPWLAPGATLRIAVPNAASMDARVFRRRWFALDMPRHLHHFEPRTLRALLEASGYRVERILPEFETISLPASLVRVVLPRPSRTRDLATVTLQAALLPATALRAALGASATMEAVAHPA